MTNDSEVSTDDATSAEPTVEDMERCQKWTALALLVGFNELTKTCKTLGERVFFRMARDQAELDYARLGGQIQKIPAEGDGHILVLKEPKPHIVFQERDLALMADTVVAHAPKMLFSRLAALGTAVRAYLDNTDILHRWPCPDCGRKNEQEPLRGLWTEREDGSRSYGGCWLCTTETVRKRLKEALLNVGSTS